MPFSEDELDSRIHSSSLTQNGDYGCSTLSKAEQRKNNKPIMEKRRRARINQCLNELKALILDATNKDPARHTKLEKADILEMTVKHLQCVQRERFTAAVASDPSVVRKFKTGFNECATEVSRYIGNLEGVDDGVKKRLISHLSDCVTGMKPLHSVSTPLPGPFSGPDVRLTNSEDLNNNDSARFQVPGGLQLIPSRLPSGELALLLPNCSTLSSLFLPTNTVDVGGQPHISAFTPVSKDAHPEIGVNYENSSHSEVSSTSNDGTHHLKTAASTTSQCCTSSLLIPVTELSVEYKQATYGCSHDKSNIYKPLTVYTDPAYDLATPSSRSPALTKSPLDFSIKKETQQSACGANFVSRKRPLEDLSCNIEPFTKSTKRTERRENAENDNVLDGADAVSGRRDMWRPW